MKQLVVFLGVLILSACTLPAPHYSPSVTNVNLIKSATKGAQVGEVKAEKEAQSISLRGSSLQSPYNKSYAEYLKSAITSELEKAKLLDNTSTMVLTANILENDLDASGFSTGEGIMKVEFTVMENDTQVYKKIHTAEITWESSFIGAVAIPNAQMSYPKMVEKLLGSLYGDQEFMRLLK